MNNEDIKSKINDFLIEEFEIDQELINPDAKLKDDLGLDSLDFVDVVVEIEDVFGIYIPLPIQTFGFWVAIAFLAASYIIKIELQRKENEGLVSIIKVKKLIKVTQITTGYITRQASQVPTQRQIRSDANMVYH